MTTARLYEITVQNNPGLLVRLARFARSLLVGEKDHQPQQVASPHRIIHSDEV